MQPLRRFISAAIVLSTICALLFYLLNPVHVDDNFITYRVAANLAHGMGFVHSVGDVRMSVTSPLWTGLMGIVALVFPHDSLPSIARALGAAALLLTAPLLALVARRQYGGLAILLIPAPFIGAVAAEGVGNEVPWVIAFVLSSLFFLLRDTPRYLLVGVFLGLAYLARADAILMAGLVGLATIHRGVRHDGPVAFYRNAALLAVGFLMLALPWHIYYFHAFGDVFPNTLKVKQLQGTTGSTPLFHQALPANLAEVLGMSKLAAVLALAGVVSVGYRLPLLLAWPLLHCVAYSALRVPNFEWYYYPILLLVPISMVCAIIEMARLWQRHSRARSTAAAFAVVFTGLVFLNTWNLLSPQALAWKIRNIGWVTLAGDERFQTYSQVARWFNANEPMGQGHAPPLVMAFEIGIIGFYAPGIRIIDPPGILFFDVTDKTIMRWGYIARKYRPKYAVFRDLNDPILVLDEDSGLGPVRYERVYYIPGRFYHQTIYRLIDEPPR